ncbi:MAG: DUF2127 domain-containing protein [Acidobacteriaceae bacterium]|nr:DUF2127 domain-containing protein [Acidobacteriaceae bacterium]
MGQVQTAPPRAKHGESTTTLLLIALFKLVKGILLIAVGIGALKLLHRDISETVSHWIDILRVDPDNRFVHGLVARLLRINQNQLKALSAGTFIYAGLLLTEGTGLLLRKRWAEYFTIITTAGLIPLEIYEITEQVTAAKIIVLLINIAIVLYLLVRVRRARVESKH